MNIERIINNHAYTVYLVGEMCSGKDYLGKILIDEYGYTRIALADALKQEIAQEHGITVADINKNKELYRHKLQDRGESRRKENISYWLNEFCDLRKNLPGPVVCTDVRYINEAIYGITQPNSVVIRIVVPKSIRDERALALYGKVPDSIYNHPSEAQVPLCPFNFLINGTLSRDMLHATFESLLEDWVAMGKPILRQDPLIELSLARNNK